MAQDCHRPGSGKEEAGRVLQELWLHLFQGTRQDQSLSWDTSKRLFCASEHLAHLQNGLDL